MFPRKVALPFFDQLFQVNLMFDSKRSVPVKSTGTPTLRISTKLSEKVNQKKLKQCCEIKHINNVKKSTHIISKTYEMNSKIQKKLKKSVKKSTHIIKNL